MKYILHVKELFVFFREPCASGSVTLDVGGAVVPIFSNLG